MGKAAALAVSCLMVTAARAERLAGMRRAIAGFCQQTHPARELVILLERTADTAAADAILRHIASLNASRIRVLDPPAGLPLGTLRNLSRQAATGDVFVQWDDDDMYHPRRIEKQLDALRASAARATCLEDVMQYFPDTRTLHCINWRATVTRCHPGTLMCMRDVPIDYPEHGPESRLGEDSVVIAQLRKQGLLDVLAGSPFLYVYVSHGANSWPAGHHRMLADRLAVSSGLLRRRETALRQELGYFDFGPGPVSVHGYNGPAFELTGASHGES